MPDILIETAEVVTRMRSEVLELLGQDKISMMFAVGVVLLGLAAAVVLLVRAAVRVQHVRRAVAAVERAQDASDFARKFDAISTRIESSRFLRAPWIRLKSTLIFSNSADTGSIPVHCTANASDIFSIGGITDSWRSDRVLPGLFLSLALLLTVIGVAASMSTALEAVDVERSSPAHVKVTGGATQQKTTEPTNRASQIGQQTSLVAPTQAALRQLLSAGKASFSVAIAGIFISLLLTATLGICTSWLRSALQKLSAAIQQRVVRISFEAAVLGRLAAILTANERSTSSTGSAYAENLKLAIEQSVPLHIDHATEKLQAAIEHNSSQSSQTNREAMERLVDDLRKLISEQASESIRSSNQQLREQFLGLREHLLSLNSVATGSGAGPLLPNNENPGSSSVPEIRDIPNDLNSRIEKIVADPLRTMTTAINDLQASLAAIQNEASASEPPNDDGKVQVLYAALSSQLQDLQAAVERNTNEAASENTKLVTEIVERLEACIAHPIDEVASAVGEVRAKLHAAEKAAAQVSLAPSAGSTLHNEGLARSISEITAMLMRLENGMSAVGSMPASQKVTAEQLAQLQSLNATTLAAISDGNDKVVEQNQAAIKCLTERIETTVVNPLQGLTASTAKVGDALAGYQSQAAQTLKGTTGEVGQAVRLALEDLRGELTVLTAGSQDDVTIQRQAFFDQMRQCCDDLSRAARHLELNGSTIETRLGEIIDAVPGHASRAAENASTPEHATTHRFETVADRLEATVVAPIQGLTSAVEDIHRMLSSAQGGAIDIRSQLAAGSNLAAREVRIATNDMRTAINAMTAQAQAECEIARQTLIEQIGQSVGALENVTRQRDENDSIVATEIAQLIESAPERWSHEAGEVAKTAERIVRSATEHARALLEQTASARTAAATQEIVQTTAALTQISNQLLHQSADARDAINSQLANTVRGIERASISISAAIAGLSANLKQDTYSVTADVLEMLVQASAELQSATQKSDEATVQSVAGIWQAATEARRMIATDLEQHRGQLEKVNAVAINRVHETAVDVAQTMANYSDSLSTTTDKTLQALSAGIRILETQFSREDASVREGKAAVPKRLTANSG